MEHPLTNQVASVEFLAKQREYELLRGRIRRGCPAITRTKYFTEVGSPRTQRKRFAKNCLSGRGSSPSLAAACEVYVSVPASSERGRFRLVSSIDVFDCSNHIVDVSIGQRCREGKRNCSLADPC